MSSLSQPSPSNLRSLLSRRAVELFNMCDMETKGFINKKDIQKLCGHEPGFTPDILEEVFESLDADGNGFLTLDEFTFGFTNLFQSEEIEQAESCGDEMTSNYSGENSSSQQFSIEQDDEEIDEDFKRTMEDLGANELVKNSETNIKDLWIRLRSEDPSMLSSFEALIGNISHEMNQSKSNFNMLESALQNKSNDYDSSIRKLYEEMESQINSEKARIYALEDQKDKELKRSIEAMETDLHEKEKYMQESISRQIEMERKLNDLNCLEYQQKMENERLLKENAALEEQLMASVKNLEDSKSYISTLQSQSSEEKAERSKMVWMKTERIAEEREHLAKELDKLRKLNNKLQDERDELELKRQSSTSQSRVLHKRDSVLSNYFPNYKLTPTLLQEASFDEQNIKKTQIHVIKQCDTFSDSVDDSTEPPELPANKIERNYADVLNVPANATPDRVFKVVFIGDSGVGKTSFVQRFCHDGFRESFNTTIGVDFQVKLMSIEGRIIALQLWDTAGQERYRSITKQYFRKADGVVCMYDITSEQSFKNLRNWIQSIREYSSDDCLITIIGNKLDLCDNDNHRVVRHRDGASLAAETDDCLFFEASSRKSINIIEAMEAIARVLTEREDKQIEDVLNLNMKVDKKKGCCN